MTKSLYIRLRGMIHEIETRHRGYRLVVTLTKEDIAGDEPISALTTFMGYPVQIGEITSVGIII